MSYHLQGPYIPENPSHASWTAEAEHNELRSDFERRRPDNTTVMVYILGATASGEADIAMDLAHEYTGSVIHMHTGIITPSRTDQYRAPQYSAARSESGDNYGTDELVMTTEDVIGESLYHARLPILAGGDVYRAERLIYNNIVATSDLDWLHNRSTSELIALCGEHNWGLPFDTDRHSLVKHAATRYGRRTDNLRAPVGTLVLGVQRTPEDMKERVRAQTRTLFEQGLEAEVLTMLRRTGGLAIAPLTTTIGYREFESYVNRRASLQDVETAIADATYQYGVWQTGELQRRIPDIQWIQDTAGAQQHFEAHLQRVWKARKDLLVT